MAEHQYIQLPPDSTGKKVFHRAEVVLNYKNGVVAISVGDRISGATSGTEGDVTYINGTLNSGELRILLTIRSSIAFIDSEDLKVESIKVAEANGTGNQMYIQGTVLVSGKSLEHQAEIDSDGSLFVRFDNGDPAVDITGRQEVANPTPIASYDFKYNKTSNNQLSITEDGTAVSTYLPTYNANRMQVNTTSGDKVVVQSHQYHIVPSGLAFGTIFTLWVGDTGKANCTRRWGLFDEDDGYYFEVQGTQLNVVWRTSVSGSVVEYRIPQAQWNIDTLDGSGEVNNPSEESLDVSMTNVYFIESTGAAGSVMGYYVNGKRIRFHSFSYASYFPGVAVQKSAQLPVRAEIENTGTTASTSELYLFSIDVLSNTTFENLYATRKGLGSLTTGTKSVDSNWNHMFSMRAAQLFNGKDNRAWIFPYLTKLISDTAPVEYVVSIAPSAEVEGVSDGTWTQTSLAEYSIDSTNATPFVNAVYEFAGPNMSVVCNHIREGIGPSEAKMIRYADITASPLTVSVYCRSLGATTNVTMTFTWLELY